MKYFKISVYVCVLLCFIMSCADEPIVKTPEDVRFRFSIIADEEGVVNVRSVGDDVALDNVYVVLLDGSGDDAKIVNTFTKATTTGNNVYYASISDANGKHVLVLANVERILTEQSGAVGTTYGELKKALYVQLAQKGGGITEDAFHAPMVSEPTPYDSSKVPEITLHRSAAKVYVSDQSKNDSYQIIGTNMCNVASEGYAFGGVSATSPTYGHFVGSDGSLDTPLRGIDRDDPKQSDPLYVFDTPNAEMPCLILKGSYDGAVGFIKLALWNDKKEYYAITRNNQYIITINKIATAGYRTAQEAIDNEPANSGNGNFDISVVDPSSHDIVTNGKEYLGVSNSSLIIYQNEVKSLVATTLSYTVNQAWIDKGVKGSITANGEGLTSETTTFDLTTTDVKSQAVKISCTEAFTEGSLTIHIGNLSKVIRIKRYADLSATPDEMEFEGMTVGDQGGSAMRDEITFAEESGKYDALKQQSDLFVSEKNTIFALVSANVGYGDQLQPRDGEFYVASSKDDGRTKVMFHQKKLDVYTELAQIRPYTFVGTFHRWDETAERIIRIKTIDKVAGEWKAIVVVGQDFIELSADRSPDTGITMHPYGVENIDAPMAGERDAATWTTKDEVEDNCQFQSGEGKQLISGKGPNVYFRVGMKSKLKSKDSAPRYGLVALLHSTGTHMIYVRQGEADDYLMRPNDPMTNIAQLSRSKAVKISPFNLTLKKELRDNNTKYYDFDGTEKAVFTDYPSKGGYFFQAYPKRAYFPVGAKTEVSWKESVSEQTDNVDLYPDNYRRPTDSERDGGVVEKSELRQSFWLNPQPGMENSSFDNSLRGYIADGYYDRRAMRVPNTVGHSDEGVSDIYKEEKVNDVTYTIPTMVGEGAEIGYAGMLLYNPYNFASIFVPANGSRLGTRGTVNFGELRGTGAESNLWTSSKNSSNLFWYLATGYYAVYDKNWNRSYKYVFDNYRASYITEAFSIRCVLK